MNWRNLVSYLLIPAQFSLIAPSFQTKDKAEELEKLIANMQQAKRVLGNVHTDGLGHAHGTMTNSYAYNNKDNATVYWAAQKRFLDEVVVNFVKECVDLKLKNPSFDYETIFRQAKERLGEFDIKYNEVKGTVRESEGQKERIEFHRWVNIIPKEPIMYNDGDGGSFELQGTPYFDRDVLLITDFEGLIKGYRTAKQLGPKTLGNGKQNNLFDYELDYGKQEEAVINNLLYHIETRLESLPWDAVKSKMDPRLNDLSMIVASIWDTIPMQEALPAPNTQTQRQQNVSQRYANMLALGSLTILKDLLAVDVDEVIVADRGNRPAGYMLDLLVKELDLDLKVNYTKLSKIKKISESYAFTDQFSNSKEFNITDIKEDVKLLRKIRKEYNERARNNGNLAADLSKFLIGGVIYLDTFKDSMRNNDGMDKEERMQYLQSKIKNIENGLEDFYEKTKLIVKELYKESILSNANLKGKYVFFDDFFKTGQTRDDTIKVLREAGYDTQKDNFIATVHTDENYSNVCFIKPLFSAAYDWKKKCDWEDLIKYHNRQLEIGIEYGMDKDINDSSKMFEKGFVDDFYKLPMPEKGVYHEIEALSISTVLNDYFMVGRDQWFSDKIRKLIVGKEFSESLQKEVNHTVVGSFYTGLWYGVQRLFSDHTKEEISNYINGISSPKIEEKINLLEQEFKKAA